MTPALYGLIALGVVAIGSSGWAWIQGERLETAKTKLADCTMRYEQTLALVEKQNRAVNDLVNRGKEAQERAAKALAEAEKKSAESGREQDRLRRVLGQKPKTACAAGEAVTEVRKGLTAP